VEKYHQKAANPRRAILGVGFGLSAGNLKPEIKTSLKKGASV